MPENLSGGTRPQARVLARWSVASALGAGFGLWLLHSLPYSTSLVGAASMDDISRRPGPDFQVGPLVFPVTEYSRNPSLQPFRHDFERHCQGQRGIQAATCVTASLASRFPNGVPSDEFVSPRFEPADHLRRHLAGERGHCLTRSAILASELLATGIPARIVQIVPGEGSGHTLVEVWDDAVGWVMIDPTYGGALGTAEGPASAAKLLASPEKASWHGLGLETARYANLGAGLSPEYLVRALHGNLMYPEPWLFLRVGQRASPWPFRGHFVRVGHAVFDLGPAQRLLHFAVPALLLGSLMTLALAAWALRDRRSVGVAPRVATGTIRGTGARRANPAVRGCAAE